MDSWLGEDWCVRFLWIWSSSNSATLSHSHLWFACMSRIPLLFWSRSEEWLILLVSYHVTQMQGWPPPWWKLSRIFHTPVHGLEAWTLELCGWAAMWWILGKFSTRIPLAHHLFCVQSSVLRWTLEPTQSFFPSRVWCLGCDSSFQSTIQNLKTRKPSRARDWWLLHHPPIKVKCFMKNPPS